MTDIDSKLARLGKETERLAPRGAFTESVMLAVSRGGAPSFGASVVRFGKTMLAVAALCAVAGVTFGLASERAADEALATTFGAEEFDW
jgi:hypothetical protein